MNDFVLKEIRTKKGISRKELSELSGVRPNGLTYMLEKAPQSWCYVDRR